MNQQENREIRISPDALIALVVAEAEDRELSAMPSLEEMNAAFHPSEEFQKKMDRLLKQAKRKQERKGAWRATKRLFVVATTVVTAFACILMPVQAVQEAVVSTVLNWRDQFVEILYSKEDDPNAVILLQNVELTYLPEGFTETPSNRTSNTSFWNEYQSENGEWLTVRILPIQDKQSTFVDDEYTHYYFLKVQLIRDVSSNPVEDGYQIVEKFFSENSSVKNSISEKSKNSMCKDLVEKLESENYAIWNLIEVLSFGDFVRLYTLYDREYGNHNKGLIQCLYAVRCLRNAAAHNNCLLNSLRLPYTRKIHSSYSISRAVSQIPNGPKTTSREKKLANPVIHDFVAMLYVYKKIVSSPRTAEHFTKELHDLFDIRMKRHSNYFESNECISSAYHFMKTVINDWFPSGQEL